MPIDLTCETDEILELDEYVARMNRVDCADLDAVLATAPDLKALANNRRFLLDHMIAQLADWDRRSTEFQYRYTPNVFVLAQAEQFAVRAVIWPPGAEDMSEVEKTVFSFELPHDHNFDFMTVGYYGPGYETDLFEYDIANVVGVPGEPVDLRAMGRQRLEPGRVWFFRKGVDIHTQLPPAATSISLNLLLHHPEITPQYAFDVERRTILKNIHAYPQVNLIELIATAFGDDVGAQLRPLTERHPDEMVRLACYRAAAQRLGPAAWAAAADDHSELVRAHAALARG